MRNKCGDCDGEGRLECEECGSDDNGNLNCAGVKCNKCNGTGLI